MNVFSFFGVGCGGGIACGHHIPFVLLQNLVIFFKLRNSVIGVFAK